MAQVVSSRVKVTGEVLLKLSEEEIMALDGIFGYREDDFLKAFYEKMGSSYVKPYESGVRSLHKTVKGQLASVIADIKQAKMILSQHSK